METIPLNSPRPPLPRRKFPGAVLVSLFLVHTVAWAIPPPACETPEQKMGRAQKALWEAREAVVSAEIRKELAENDLDRTGLVGIEWSRLTTSPGSLEAKRVSTRPEWIGVVRHWLKEAGLLPGDAVAIGSSGSFPGLLLAARLAAESMGLRPIIIGSLTSSNYGANIESFDLLAMEAVLRKEGLIEFPLLGITPGGNRDRVHGADPESRDFVMRRLSEWDDPSVPVFLPETIRGAFDLRTRAFFEEGKAKVFINIGGHAINMGAGVRILNLPAGLIRPEDFPDAASDEWRNSVLAHALSQGIPVIHLLNIRGLSEEWRIPHCF